MGVFPFLAKGVTHFHLQVYGQPRTAFSLKEPSTYKCLRMTGNMNHQGNGDIKATAVKT